jgi:uncharacterized membrane protein
MLEAIFYVLLIFAVLLILFTVQYEKHIIWSIIGSALACFIWAVLAISIYELERPYEMFNVTSGNIETGIHEITMVGAGGISWLFAGIALLMGLYCIFMAMEQTINVVRR